MTFTGGGFSEVDTSGRSRELVAYLDRVARLFAERRRRSLDRLGLTVGASVLDAGCGLGELCIELRTIVGTEGRVVGVDASTEMIRLARERAEQAHAEVELEVADIHDLPFRDESFDAARAERVLQHLADPALAMRELARVTKRGGRVVVGDPNHAQAAVATARPELWNALLAAGALRRVRNPRAGSHLREWAVHAGLVDLELAPAVAGLSWPMCRELMALEDARDHAVATGAMTAAEGEWFFAEQAERDRTGTFCATMVGYVLSGVRA